MMMNEMMMMTGTASTQVRALSGEDLLAFKDKVYCLCLGFAGNAADARDMAQDTYAKALAHYSQDRPENPQAWILRIARNTCLDLMRRRKVRGPSLPVSEFCRHRLEHAREPGRSKRGDRHSQEGHRQAAAPPARCAGPARVRRTFLPGDREDAAHQSGYGHVALEPGPEGRAAFLPGGTPWEKT